MDVGGVFVERLAGAELFLFAAGDLHDDGAFEDVDEDVGVVAVGCGGVAGGEGDGEHGRFLAREFGEVFGEQLSDGGALGGQSEGGGEEKDDDAHGLV